MLNTQNLKDELMEEAALYLTAAAGGRDEAAREMRRAFDTVMSVSQREHAALLLTAVNALEAQK